MSLTDERGEGQKKRAGKRLVATNREGGETRVPKKRRKEGHSRGGWCGVGGGGGGGGGVVGWGVWGGGGGGLGGGGVCGGWGGGGPKNSYSI